MDTIRAFCSIIDHILIEPKPLMACKSMTDRNPFDIRGHADTTRTFCSVIDGHLNTPINDYLVDVLDTIRAFCPIIDQPLTRPEESTGYCHSHKRRKKE